MIRTISIAAALLVSGTLLIPTTTQAQTPARGYYAAVPAGPVSRSALVTRSTGWRLVGDTFVADRAPERDAILCRLVAEKVGGLQSFSVAGRPYDADALAKCNARVKHGASEVAATAK